jgi:hypothetical protein
MIAACEPGLSVVEVLAVDEDGCFCVCAVVSRVRREDLHLADFLSFNTCVVEPEASLPHQ